MLPRLSSNAKPFLPEGARVLRLRLIRVPSGIVFRPSPHALEEVTRLATCPTPLQILRAASFQAAPESQTFSPIRLVELCTFRAILSSGVAQFARDGRARLPDIAS